MKTKLLHLTGFLILSTVLAAPSPAFAQYAKKFKAPKVKLEPKDAGVQPVPPRPRPARQEGKSLTQIYYDNERRLIIDPSQIQRKKERERQALTGGEVIRKDDPAILD